MINPARAIVFLTLTCCSESADPCPGAHVDVADVLTQAADLAECVGYAPPALGAWAFCTHAVEDGGPHDGRFVAYVNDPPEPYWVHGYTNFNDRVVWLAPDLGALRHELLHAGYLTLNHCYGPWLECLGEDHSDECAP